MSTKTNPGLFDCYAHAAPDEDMFILLGRDRHGPALVRLWALMREKEGEPAEVVAEANSCADRMEDYCRQQGKSPLPLSVLLSLAASLASDPAEGEENPEPAAPPPEPLREGDIVVVGRAGVPCRLEKVFGPDADDRVRGKANVRLPRAQIPTTVDAALLRKALPQEITAYRAAGGR